MNLRGTVAELRFIEWLRRKGCDVMVPFHTTNCAADVAWRNLERGEHHWVCGQVKKVNVPADRNPFLNLTRSDDGLYHVSHADFLAAIDYENGRLWLIPFHRVVDLKRVTLSNKWGAYLHEL